MSIIQYLINMIKPVPTINKDRLNKIINRPVTVEDRLADRWCNHSEPHED